MIITVSGPHTTTETTTSTGTQPSEQEPQAREEPAEQPTASEEQTGTTAAPEEIPKPTKVSRELRNLESELDGHAWTCNKEHGRQLRVRTAGIHKSWDNVIYLEDEEETTTEEGRMEQRD